MFTSRVSSFWWFLDRYDTIFAIRKWFPNRCLLVGFPFSDVCRPLWYNLRYSNFFRITNNKHGYMSFALSQHTSFAPKSPGIFTRIWASLYTRIPIPVYCKIGFSIFWSNKSIFLYIACIWVLLFYRIWALLNHSGHSHEDELSSFSNNIV